MMYNSRNRAGDTPHVASRADGGVRHPGAPTASPVFDRWLTHHLCRLYSPIVSEPIPSDLLRILEERLG